MCAVMLDLPSDIAGYEHTSRTPLLIPSGVTHIMKSKTCSICASPFVCGPEGGNESCWCYDHPPAVPLDLGQDCRCPACLRLIVEGKVAERFQTAPPEDAPGGVAGDFAAGERLVEGVDYYLNEEGLLVFTARHLLRRGHCCRNGCVHCPYGYRRL